MLTDSFHPYPESSWKN